MHEFTLSKDTDEMDSDELRSTLDEFMDKHAENVDEYESVVDTRDEFSETVDELEAEISEYSETTETLRAKFAEIVAEDSSLFDADEVADRFSLDELITKADTLGAFSLPAEATEPVEDEDEGEEAPTFADKPEQGEAVAEAEKAAFREQAEGDLKNVLGDF